MLRSRRTLLRRGCFLVERLVGIAADEFEAVLTFVEGLPKAAMLSHYNLIAQHVQISEWKPKPYEVS